MTTVLGNTNTTFPTPTNAATSGAASGASTSNGDPTAQVNGSSSTATDQAGISQTFDQFLTLLTTQLQNQDPMSPMDSSQFTNQLVMFSQVEQQLKTNDNLTKMITATTASQASLGLNYIGLNVDMTGSAFGFNGQTPVAMSYNMPSQAAQSVLTVLDANNNVVYSSTAEDTAGDHAFTWDGTDTQGNPVAAGVYQIQVGALDSSGKNLTVATTVPGLVTGVQTADDGTTDLIVNGKNVPMSSVTKVTD